MIVAVGDFGNAPVLYTESVEGWYQSNSLWQVLVLVLTPFTLDELLPVPVLLTLLLLLPLLLFPLLVRYLRVKGKKDSFTNFN